MQIIYLKLLILLLCKLLILLQYHNTYEKLPIDSLDFKITIVNKLLNNTLKHKIFINLKIQHIVNSVIPIKLNIEKLLQF